MIIELMLLGASRWGSRALCPGIGLYLCEVRPLVSFVQSVAQSYAAFCFIQVVSVDFRE